MLPYAAIMPKKPVVLIIRDGWGINPGGRAKAVENGDATLLADPDDAQAWQAHFRDLVASADLRKELKERGLERVKAFSWRISAQAYLEQLAGL